MAAFGDDKPLGFPLKVESCFGSRYSAGVVCGSDAEAGCFLHVAAGFQLGGDWANILRLLKPLAAAPYLITELARSM